MAEQEQIHAYHQQLIDDVAALGQVRFDQASERLQDLDQSYLTYLATALGATTVHTQPIKDGPTVSGQLVKPSVAEKLDDILRLGEEVSPDGKIEGPKQDLVMIQRIEHRTKSSNAVEQLHDLCLLGIIAAVNKPATLPPHLAVDKILGEHTGIKKGRKETSEETAFRCAVLALRKYAFISTLSDSEKSGISARPSEAELDNRAALKAYAKEALKYLVDEKTTSHKTQDEIFVALDPKKEHEEKPQPTAEELIAELPVQHVGWEIVPPATLEEWGIELPTPNNSTPRIGDEETSNEHKRQTTERLRAAVNVARQWSPYWNEVDGVRLVQREVEGSEAAKERRRSPYLVLVLPTTLSDGRPAEHAIGISKYGNVSFVYRAERGLMPDGSMLYTWEDVFQENKIGIEALGGERMIYSDKLEERGLLDRLLGEPKPLPRTISSAVKSPEQPN